MSDQGSAREAGADKVSEGADAGSGPAHGVPVADDAQVERLLPLVYHELRRIASSMLRAGPAMTIQPTALVHEAFLKLSREDSSSWNDESHFRAIASIAMRRILADHVRTRTRLKRGGDGGGSGGDGAGSSAEKAEAFRRIDLSLCADAVSLTSADPSDLHEALQDLEAASPRVAKLVIYRFFGDLDVHQAAERLGVSVSTAEADWRFAKAWLRRRLSPTEEAS